MNCLMSAWNDHEAELRGWLRRRIGNSADAEDLLQEVFLKAMRYGDRFCHIVNTRAWLFEVARNSLADQLRLSRPMVELPGDLTADLDEPSPVESLAVCLPRVLSEMSLEDRQAITTCDLEGRSQEAYAHEHGLSLAAAKSRVQRARKRLREQLTKMCQVHLDPTGQVSDFKRRSANH